MCPCLQVLILFTLGFASSSALKEDNDRYSITIRMPQVVSKRPDDLICTARRLDPKETYIVKFTPHASKATAHHMMVYGCHVPATTDKDSWTCDHDETRGFSPNAVCGESPRKILFAWALDAPEKSLPEGVGLRISGDTKINYLVIQLHFANIFPPGMTDSSGVTVEMTHRRPPQQAGYLVLGNWGYIPPQETGFYMESSCTFHRNYTIYPIGYRTHAHKLGVVSSGYRIRDGKWMEIGRMSPQLPETFYEVSNPGMDIRNGDVLASRCVMNSMARNDVTVIGTTNHDEMCNFYIMYSTYHQENLDTDYCFKGAQDYHWLDEFNADDIPANSDSLEGITGAEKVREKFKWS